MALGDGVRRNIRTIGDEERQRFARALLALQGTRFPGMHVSPARGGSRYWFRQLMLHMEAQEHRGVEFLPWHRELCNRFEEMLRSVDPDLSLHYWDWNDDPREIFGPAEPAAPGDADDLKIGLAALLAGAPAPAPDSLILHAPTFRRLRALLERKYAQARVVYFGGTFVNAHVSLHDPLALLLAANVDRLFAMWQAQMGQAWRLDPSRLYGEDAGGLNNAFVEPWSTGLLTRRWVDPTRPQMPKTYRHASLVAPPCYDTLPARIAVDEVTNPARLIRFHDVHAGKTFARAACFRVHGRGNLTFAITDGPTAPYSVVTPRGAVTTGHAQNLYQEARIWFGYTGGRPGTTAPCGSVTIRCLETGEDFVFTLRANTVAVPTSGNVPSGDDAVEASARDGCRKTVTWTWTWRAASA